MKTILLYTLRFNPGYHSFYRSLMREGRRRGWCFAFVEPQPGPDEPARMARLFARLKPAGLVSGYAKGGPLEPPPWLPSVWVDCDRAPRGAPLVRHDNASFGEAAADAEDDDEYVPGEMEKHIDAMPPEKWRLWQIAGGAAVGLAAVAALFVFGEELSTYGIVVAALLALLLPRYLERAWRHPLNVARRAMVIAMIIGLAVMFVIIGARTGFSFRASK